MRIKRKTPREHIENRARRRQERRDAAARRLFRNTREDEA